MLVVEGMVILPEVVEVVEDFYQVIPIQLQLEIMF